MAKKDNTLMILGGIALLWWLFKKTPDTNETTAPQYEAATVPSQPPTNASVQPTAPTTATTANVIRTTPTTANVMPTANQVVQTVLPNGSLLPGNIVVPTMPTGANMLLPHIPTLGINGNYNAVGEMKF